MRIILAERITAGVQRIRDHLDQYAPGSAAERIDRIIAALEILLDNPEMGRRCDGDRRELVIGRRGQGYIALYKFIASEDVIWILALRAQREAGY